MIGAAIRLTDMMGWGDHMGDWGAGWWILMAVLMVAFWGLLIVGILSLVRSMGWGHHHQGGPGAVELLDRRLAHGEITPDEYRERRAVLRGEGTTEGS